MVSIRIFAQGVLSVGAYSASFVVLLDCPAADISLLTTTGVFAVSFASAHTASGQGGAQARTCGRSAPRSVNIHKSVSCTVLCGY
jgi:hypothetical protein